MAQCEEDLPQRRRDAEEGREPECQAFEGVCSLCGQPYCMDYVKQLEETLFVMKKAITELEHHCNERQKIIDSMRDQLKIKRIIEGNPLIIRGRA